MLHDLNSLLHERQYERLEELLDPAGFSGLISRTVANRLARASRGLVVNQYHNGYPDLLVKGQYPGDAVQHGEGGLEIKASRYPKGWQSHGPRAGWFGVVQFRLDERADVAVHDLEPTSVQAVLVAELTAEDWSWQPAREGRIRSGTASVRSAGVAKLRAGAVWVDPNYRTEHQRLLRDAQAALFRNELPPLILAILREMGRAATVDDLARQIAAPRGLDVTRTSTQVSAAVRKLQAAGQLRSEGGGRTLLLE